MRTTQKVVLVAATLMFFFWVALTFWILQPSNPGAGGTEIGISHVLLGLLFAILILLRPKRPEESEQEKPSGQVAAAVTAVAGVASYAAGVVFDLGQPKWIGVLLLLVASLRWALPGRYSRDTVMAAILLYWIYPIPGSILAALHLAMQKVSVHGAEYLLHALNYRVWADGSVIRTAVATFMVPEACSGLTTVTTVLMCAAGIGILLRLKLLNTVILLVAGAIQVVLLNTVRISLMVMLADPSQPGWSDQFLHDSLGVLLLVSVVLIQLEAVWWWRAGVHDTAAAGEDERTKPGPNESAMRLPAFWQHLLLRPWVMLLVILAAALVLFFALRCGTHHRAEMIGGVATELVTRDIEQAERACRAALKVEPANYEVRKELVRILLMRGQHAAGLRELDLIPAAIRQASHDHAVLLAWGLMGTGRPDEARAIVSNIAVVVGQDMPGVAMVEAEFAALRGDLDVVAEMIVRASKAPALMHRVRALYPCLAAAGRWDAITASDSTLPYVNSSHALIAINAFLEQKDAKGAARTLTVLMETHGNDPRLLRYIYVLAALWPDSKWETTFSAKLIEGLNRFEPDELAVWVEQSFSINRPDLAWMAYSRLREMDPSHPAVFLMPAWMGDVWFSFRKRFLGMSSGASDDMATLTPDLYLYLVRKSVPWKKLWKDIPMVAELYATTDEERKRAGDTRRKLLDRALVEFDARTRKATLSLDMKYLYAQALDMAGRPAEGHSVLSGIAAENAGESNKVLLAHAGMYRRSGDWQNVYETLRVCSGQAKVSLPAMLAFCESQYQMTLGVGALESIRRILEAFPDSAQAAALQVRILNRFLGPEETLFAIERLKPRMRGFEALEVEILLKTQRFSEAKVLQGNIFAGGESPAVSNEQAMVPVPAELSLQWGITNIPSEAEFGTNAVILEKNQLKATSPFMKDLIRLWLACNRSGCSGRDADPARWIACGRDSMERAMALNQLTLLLCRHGKTVEALDAARRAVAEAPRSGLLRRLLIGLSRGRGGVQEEAFAICPDDPEIWLSHVVAGVSSGKPEIWALEEVRSAIKTRRYPVATVVRVGDFLLRMNMVTAAAAAAVDTESKAKGYVPAHVLALRCAEKQGDRKWALSATARAIEHSVSPQPYLCGKLVEFWGSLDKPDWDVLFALGRLRALEPHNPLWMEMLGRAKFMAGGLNNLDARDQIKDAMSAGHTNATAYVLLAEVERRLGNSKDAVVTLKQGLKLFPDDLAMLNNLAYTLGENPDTLPDALALVPQLLKAGGRNTDVLDTVQLIYIRSGKTVQAEQSIAGELQIVAENSQAWAKARLRLAQVRMKEGKVDVARAIIADLVKSVSLDIPADDLYDLGKLMVEIEERLWERKWPSISH